MRKKRTCDATTWEELQEIKKIKRDEYKARRQLRVASKKPQKAKPPCSAKKIREYKEKQAILETRPSVFVEAISQVDFKKKLPF